MRKTSSGGWTFVIPQHQLQPDIAVICKTFPPYAIVWASPCWQEMFGRYAACTICTVIKTQRHWHQFDLLIKRTACIGLTSHVVLCTIDRQSKSHRHSAYVTPLACPDGKISLVRITLEPEDGGPSTSCQSKGIQNVPKKSDSTAAQFSHTSSPVRIRASHEDTTIAPSPSRAPRDIMTNAYSSPRVSRSPSYYLPNDMPLHTPLDCVYRMKSPPSLEDTGSPVGIDVDLWQLELDSQSRTGCSCPGCRASSNSGNSGKLSSVGAELSHLAKQPTKGASATPLPPAAACVMRVPAMPSVDPACFSEHDVSGVVRNDSVIESIVADFLASVARDKASNAQMRRQFFRRATVPAGPLSVCGETDMTVVTSTDAPYPVLWASPSWLRVVGFSESGLEVVGRTLRCIQGHETDAKALAILRLHVSLRRRLIDLPLTNYAQTGQPFTHLLTIEFVQPTVRGGPALCRGMSSDVRFCREGCWADISPPERRSGNSESQSSFLETWGEDIEAFWASWHHQRKQDCSY